MSEAVVRPQDVLADGLRDTLCEAIIEAYMRKGCIELGHTNMEWGGEKEDGEWIYRLPVSGAGDPKIACDKSGNWRQKKTGWWDSGLDGSGSDTVDAGDNAYEVQLFDAPAAWERIRTEVASWIDPWVNDCPSPNEYINQINSLATVAKQLYAGNAPAGGGEGSAPDSADPDLWDSLTELGISADSTSLSVDLFQRTYATDIWKTIGGQYALVYGAGLAMTAEMSAWSASYKSLRSLLQAAASDFEIFAGSGEGSGQGRDAALGATAAVAGLLGATAGKIVPPFGVAMGVLSGSVAVFRVMNPVVPAVADTSLLLEGGTYAEKWDSFKTKIQAISDDLAVAEEAIADGCRAMVTDLEGSPDNYSLTRGGTSGQGFGDDFEGMLGRDLNIQGAKLRNVAGACETIGNHQTGLAGILGGTDATGASSSDVYDEWTRGTLPEGGTIGYGGSGAYWAYRGLVDAAVDLLIDEGKSSRRVADWVIEMVLGFESTDAERETELRAMEDQFDRHDLSVGNDVGDPSSISST